MKAAMNGVPSLSVLDGWWVEGHVEGTTGWSIGSRDGETPTPKTESDELYDKLERTILPMFYENSEQYMQIMRSTISLNASFFNAQRMMLQYEQNAYFNPQLSSL
jgi:starch phosphorylase